MKKKPNIIAQKLLNLYRQHHVIFGGWKSVNKIFIDEATPEVITEIKDLPTGKMLIQHIENLRSGKTPLNSIEPSLAPYGGLMSEHIESINLSESELSELRNALTNFTPDSDGISTIESLDVVKKFGTEWQIAIRSALSDYPEMLNKFNTVIKTERAHHLWKTANDILAQPVSELTRARVQANLPEYETYLPMFGDAGTTLLSKLRVFISNV